MATCHSSDREKSSNFFFGKRRRFDAVFWAVPDWSRVIYENHFSMIYKEKRPINVKRFTYMWSLLRSKKLRCRVFGAINWGIPGPNLGLEPLIPELMLV
jgi:hypothetical protein